MMSLFCISIISTTYDVKTRNKVNRNNLLLSFSILKNGSKLIKMQAETSNEKIHCLDGIKAIGTIYIIMAHIVMTRTFLPHRDPTIHNNAGNSYFINFLISSNLSTDTFLIISGMLVTQLTLNSLNRGKLNLPMMYLYRFLRFLPLVAMSLLITLSFPAFVNGPFFHEESHIANCRNHWLATLLNIQNIVNKMEMVSAYSA